MENTAYRREICPVDTIPGTVPARLSDSNLLLTLYFDEFEVANPIGAYKKKHKLGGVYFSITNLNSKFKSKLASIHPLALLKMAQSDDDLFKELVEVLVAEINSVASFTCGGEDYKVRVFAVIGDTPASAALGKLLIYNYKYYFVQINLKLSMTLCLSLLTN